MTVITKSELQEYEKICKSDRPNLKLDIDIPWQEMYEEIVPLLDQFVVHRENVGTGTWKSLTLHGYNMFATQHKKTFNHEWTQLIDFCPTAYEFFLNWPCSNRKRIRYMLLEPGGMIDWHSDAEKNSLSGAINIALNNPKECLFFQGRADEYIPWEAGDARFINLVYPHKVVNFSDERRVHMIFHGAWKHDNPEWIKMVLRSWEKEKDKPALKRTKLGMGNRHSNIDDAIKEFDGITVSERL